jgi:hypothetical protein
VLHAVYCVLLLPIVSYRQDAAFPLILLSARSLFSVRDGCAHAHAETAVLQELSHEITPSGRVKCALESSNRSLVELAESVVVFAAANPNSKVAVEAIGQKDAALAGSRKSVSISVVCSSSDLHFTTSPQSVEMEYEGVPFPFLTKMQPTTLSMVGGSMVTILGKHLPTSLTLHVAGVEVQPSIHCLPCEQRSVHIRVCWQS